MFTITKIGDRTNSVVLHEFILDTPDDLQYLPTQISEGTQTDGNAVDNKCCATGSSAFIISTSQLYMLNSKGIWCEV